MSRHTPGPWRWEGRTLRPASPDPERSAVHSILDADGGYGFICSDLEETLAELDADRRLIVAAPMLLERLRRVTFLLHSACLVFDDAEARRTALAAVEESRKTINEATGNGHETPADIINELTRCGGLCP